MNAQTTFGWDTNPTDNGDNITETINGITTTFTGPTVETQFANLGGYGNSSMNGVLISSSDLFTDQITFSFSQPVNVISILALEGGFPTNNKDYTFTPTGGTNSPITATLIYGTASVTLNWIGITSFTVSSIIDSWFGFDNLIINNSTLSTNDFTLRTVKVLPNPSSDFIEITGLIAIETYEIYNTLGQEVKKGIVLENKIIDIQSLTNGIYFLKLENKKTIKFIKE
jgi:hypothetical protein